MLKLEPNPITTIEYVGRNARELALQYYDVVRALNNLGLELFDAHIKVFILKPPEGESLDWTVQVRSCAGQRTLRITQNVPLGAVSISNL